jgi:hypothetical protein
VESLKKKMAFVVVYVNSVILTLRLTARIGLRKICVPQGSSSTSGSSFVIGIPKKFNIQLLQKLLSKVVSRLVLSDRKMFNQSVCC